ncbi:MAG: D-tyrosyl-tRNA(Tyr) deacylase [Fusobacteria bacterium]|nr:D-tyrosyl-tRNA(Tyr) deacylase [Fusobacteriota bacterium]
MRAVIQRVSESKVIVEKKIVGEIKNGLLILLGIKTNDSDKDVEYMIDKIINLRIFNDNDGKLNKSIQDINGEILIVSNFTVYGDSRKGRRPSYTESAKYDIALKYYELFIKKIKETGINCQTGIFGADMKVCIENDGPITLILDSPNN